MRFSGPVQTISSSTRLWIDGMLVYTHVHMTSLLMTAAYISPDGLGDVSKGVHSGSANGFLVSFE